ncbi:glycosyltransferase family 2 protein [Alkalicoccus daliensis]|uniref:Glycosyltransferase involved in cell wall bisynthesis n=1 Tax=Alkalicoccus daliensis TaxID=745820 RepID=A0A1G9ZLB6_9BACI|nr:glycosyltransferase family 2 protein [Alkalicoccus daliensis]SDN21771.1 Glycosyltransferase involved in cell wall bisynthesis [Alkalicoccus daliensis]
MEKLTIFTPTYNRAYCLHRCYESLCRQTTKDFIWMIIDDGSEDNTNLLVSDWITENKIKIKYLYQPNQGMHGAHNTAYENISTELNVCLDSDDFFTDSAVETILTFWKNESSEKVSGIVCLNENLKGDVIGTRLPAIKAATLYNLYHKHKVRGDKKLIYRSELTKQFRYPLFHNERYVGLDYKYLKIDEKFPLLILNQVVCCVDYQLDGSSHNMFHQYRRNPRGFAFYRKELMQLSYATVTFKFRQAVHFVSSSLLMKNKKFLKETPEKILTIAALPAGMLLTSYIKFKTTK